MLSILLIGLWLLVRGEGVVKEEDVLSIVFDEFHDVMDMYEWYVYTWTYAVYCTRCVA